MRVESLLSKTQRDSLRELKEIYAHNSGASPGFIDAGYIGRLLLDDKFVSFVQKLPKLFKVYRDKHIEPALAESKFKLQLEVQDVFRA